MPRSLRATLIRLAQKEYNILREIFEKESGPCTCYFLGLDGGLVEYELIRTMTSNFYFEIDRFRNQVVLKVATDVDDEAQFKTDLSRCSHYALYETVYEIQTADLVEPFGEEPVWTIPGQRTGSTYMP